MISKYLWRSFAFRFLTSHVRSIVVLGSAWTGTACSPGHRRRFNLKNPRVLVIGPGRQGRGGINSVISTYTHSSMWAAFDCKWLETYDDRSSVAKVWAAARSLVMAPLVMIKADIVHIHATFKTSLFRKSFFLLFAKMLGKKVILHIHAFDLEYLSQVGPYSFAARILRASDRVVALSPLWASVLRKTGAQVVVIFNPVILPGPRVDTIDVRHCPTILYMGKVEIRKGYEDLIQAMPTVLRTIPRAKLIIGGHGDILSAAGLVNKLAVANSVELLGWVFQEDRERIFRSADVFCLPSYKEGVPMAILEAMSFRLPVVCTPVGGIPDVIKPGYNGVFVQPGNVADIALAIIALLQSPEKRFAIGEAAYETIENSYSLKVVTQQLGTLYKTLVPAYNK